MTTMFLSISRLQRIWEDAVEREETLKQQKVPRAELRRAHRDVMHAYGALHLGKHRKDEDQ